MIKILVLCPDPKDATAFYRGTGPWNLIRENDIFVQYCPEWNAPTWPMLAAYDIIYMQRPFTITHRSWFDHAKRMGRILWLDFDDNLFEVPVFHKHFQQYKQATHHANIRHMLADSDVVTFSTEDLRQMFADKIGQQAIVKVIPNALHDQFFGKTRKIVGLREVIMWRGAHGHWGDLEAHKDDIREVYEAIPNWQWMFMGEPHHSAWDFMDPKRVLHIMPQEITSYIRNMASHYPGVNIFPLVDCPFNRAKSNISWVETTWASAVTVAPDFPEWRKPGITVYNKKTKLVDAVKSAIENQPKNLFMSQEYIDNNLLLSNVNQMRVDLVREVMDGK